MRVSTKRGGDDAVRKIISHSDPAAPTNSPLERVKSVILKKQLMKKQKPHDNHSDDSDEPINFFQEHNSLKNDNRNLPHALKKLPDSQQPTQGDPSTSFVTTRGYTGLPSNQHFASGFTVPSIFNNGQ